ncbi:MAG: division/cell wall cluster transcriptional repressor MraZ [Negativicoccus succinicivorans]|uniref:division/cell wall cluster transcriptional repressor MraZ n=1 Tax=Negativicoccus succinicivorans TaxID=620903 RepID=UPI0026F0BB4C|nr:division/cell wall cluster transcriptional repressor MraZ [Negativicoccus succinicivorans]MDU5027455.1 division/cell wall cluster transcriptional repressor MraZ [Negativicoccus succinicivorans]
MGKYSHSVDAKGRMIIPAGFRAELGERFVITRGLDACVTVYPLERWEQVAERLQQLSSTRKEVRMLIRFLIGGSSEVECDKQGRILLPAHLRDYAQIKREAVVVGTGNQLEIWSKTQLEAQEEAARDSISDVAAGIDLPIDFSL